MTETRPVSSAQPSPGVIPPSADRRHPQADTLARFHQALHSPADLSNSARHDESASANERRRTTPTSPPANPVRHETNTATFANASDHAPSASTLANAERGDPNASAGANTERRNLGAVTVANAGGQGSNAAFDAGRGGSGASSDAERREPGATAPAAIMTVGSLHYSMPITPAPAGPATTAANVEAARLIEQATSLLLERASRADASRFIVSLDHAIVGGASAEFVRDGAFLHVRLLARNEAAYRSMWANQAELQERLSASTGFVTRVEIIEGYGDGRPA